MGQQQLLIVILVTIIVGIATIVAIQTFSKNAQSANIDSVRNDMLTIAAAAQSWYIRPIMMDGGNNSFTGLSFNDFNFPAEAIDNTDPTKAYNMNGLYVITPGNQSFTIQGFPSSDPSFSSTDIFNQSGVEVMEATVSRNNIEWGS